MKSKSFWKQFAFELGVLFVWPAIFIVVGLGIGWALINGYVMELFAAMCCFVVLSIIVGSFVSLAWERAENAENMSDE